MQELLGVCFPTNDVTSLPPCSRSHVPSLVIPELCSWSLVDGTSSISSSNGGSSCSSINGNTAVPNTSTCHILPAATHPTHKPPLACTTSCTRPVLATALQGHEMSSGPRKARSRFRCLMVVLALRPLTQEEVVYKKGGLILVFD